MMEAETLSSAGPLACYCIGSYSIGSIHGALTNRGRIGRVINVFDGTINIRTVGDELLVITLGSTKSPVNINVSAGPVRSPGFAGLVQNGQDAVVKVDHGSAKRRAVLQLGGILVSINKPAVFQNSLQPPAPQALHVFAEASDRIFSALASGAIERVGCLINPDITTAGLLAAFLGRLASGGTSKESRLVDALLGLCGRGPGFTPAGDDFVAGYLAVFNWLSEALKIGLPIIPGEEFSRLTTWTSFRLMEYNARGLLDDQAQLMLNSIAEGSTEDYVRCTRLVGSRGHTSGIDFATGATVGLCAVADRACGTRTLDRISGILGRA